jgi:hypothetical protein
VGKAKGCGVLIGSGVGRSQCNVGVVNLYRIAEALGMNLSELFVEVEGSKRGRAVRGSKGTMDLRHGRLGVDYPPVRRYGSETILAYGAQDLIFVISSERTQDRRRDAGKK